jgi:autotransporter-associated beta strand protein
MSGNVPINLGSGRLTVVGDNTPVATYSGNISGGGGLTKNGNGTLILAGTNTYTGGTIVNQGTLQGNTLSLQGNITNNGAVVFDQSFPGVYANSISGSGSLTKMGADRLALTGSNSYTGTTNITGGTLEVDSALPAASGSQVQIGPSAALVANASIPRSILGAANSSQILANSGDVVLGDGTSYTGFSHAGTLAIGSNTLTLNSRGFANLGVLTSLAGGTLTAPNGISLGVGCNFSGSGTVNAKVAAGFGSTIEATGNLVLGNATSSVGFTSDGELYTGANTVTINDASDAVLGSLTRLGDGTSGGRLMAGTATVTGTHVNLLLDTGKNLEGRGVVTGNVKNHGHVTGDGTSLDARIVFDSPWTVSGEGTFENTMILGTFAPGNSPAIINGTNQGFGGTVQFELGGTTPGAGNGHYDQINDSASILLAGSTTLSILPWNSFVPTPGQQFEILTWQSGMNGAFGNVQVDPWFTSHGISFNVAYHNVAGTGDLTITAVPEPSSLVLLVAGAVGLAGYALRRQSVARRTGKSTALNQPRDDDSPILAFPSLSSHGRNQVRRAA